MKKTLLLLALLGMLASIPLNAKEVWWTGVTHDPETHKMEGAITTYKLLSPTYNTDSNMCWVASACNVIAWWQDRVEGNGALIIPESAPRDYDVFLKERQLWNNVGGYHGVAIQEWMTGGSKLVLGTKPGLEAKQAGLDFAGYYPRLAGACLGEYNYSNARGVNPDTQREYSYYPQYEYTLIQTYWFLSNNHDPDDPNKNQYQWASEKIVEFMENDWGVCWATKAHAMTVYGVEVDEDGLVTKIFNSDNNYSSVGYGKYTVLDVSEIKDGENKGYMDTSWRSGNASTYVTNICALRTTGIRFLDYDVRIGDNLVEEDEAVFSHYCNLIVDGKENFDLKYDLRDASVDGSPVDAKKVEQYTEDEGLSWSERYYDEEVPTGDMRLRGGKVTLVNCAEGREKLDGGGSVEGSIIFEDSRVKGTETIQEANRTLKVDRTDTIAKEIKLDATLGTNTLEVTDDHIASFGKLTGKGNLDKTGSGTAEVTGEVTLKGSIAVQEGKFVLGSSAELGSDTVITVGAAGSMESKADAAVLLTISSGTHTNDGTMTLETTVAGGTLKGSGSFAKVTVEEGGTLIIGNSPGHQEYTDMLTVNGGDVVFCVDGLATASSAESTGWGSDTYSIIHMNDHEFNYEGGQIFIDLSGAAAKALTLGAELTLVDGMGNVLTEGQLSALAANTSFRLTAEEGAAVTFNTENLVQPNFSYGMSGSSLMLTIVPEPATVTLSLLALAGLCTRRRR